MGLFSAKKMKNWLIGLCVVGLSSYLLLFGAIFYSFPTFIVVVYGIYGEGLPLGPPRSLVMQYVLCCKDIGSKGTDKYRLISMLDGVIRTERGHEELVERAESAIRALVEDKELSINWLDSRTGLSAFHHSILSYDPTSIKFLLELGADPCVRIGSLALHHQNHNALELAKSLTSRDTSLSSEEQKRLDLIKLGPLEDIIPLLEEVSKSCK